MAVRIRLKRVGKIHAAQYRVVVVDSRKKRDGRVIEEVGYYDPQPNPSIIRVVSESDKAAQAEQAIKDAEAAAEKSKAAASAKKAEEEAAAAAAEAEAAEQASEEAAGEDA